MLGEELTPWLLRYGYERGAFPMTMDDGAVEWFQPRKRCLFPIEGIHVSRSLEKRIRREDYTITFDTQFEEVMRCCFRPTDNWLSEDFIRAYGQAHIEGWAHSVECWMEGELVGGAYGVALGSCFCAESMFHKKTDASKLALWALVNRCQNLGFTIFDAQIMNPHLRSLGAYEVPHLAFEIMLSDALPRRTAWSP
jgi:leucyl/phenylalanyl-tRNA--protein transferase